jgi:hypothetical protein
MTLEMALATLVNECIKHTECRKCPLRTLDGGCYLNERCPSDWDFEEYDDAPPRIFK